MRLLIKLYLWVSSKSSSGFVFKGDLKSGSLGFAIPIYIYTNDCCSTPYRENIQN